MNWFRSNIQQGSRLALFALAIQLVLSFGHFHAIAAATASSSVATQAVLADVPPAAAPSARQHQPAPDQDSDQSNDGCAICAVIAMAHTVLFSTPPVLPVPQALEFSYRTIDAEFGYLNSARVSFQPRAPPLS